MGPGTIGERIAAARGAMPKTVLARRIGVDVKTIYRWELEGSQPESPVIAPLAAALGVDVHWLLTGESATGTEG